MKTLPLSLIGLFLLLGCAQGHEPAATAQRAATTINTEAASMATPTSQAGYDLSPLSDQVRQDLTSRLSPQALEITQRSGTEPAGCGLLLDNKEDGIYCCVVCGLPLFSSEHKFTSGTGWPSFFAQFDPQHVARHDDSTHGMVRTEIACGRCDAHLGHVFPDGPPPSGERHCLNSAALTFPADGTELPNLLATGPATTETAYFAGGCFWGIEHYFQQGDGVIDASSGYMQGDDERATYRDVCDGNTGHAESVKVVFDPSRISYRQLVDAFFRMHDPTQVDRQGPDIGSQYRSGIWTTSDAQQEVARQAIAELNESGRFPSPIATQIGPAATFHSAETYHQDYIERTGRACHVANPWSIEQVNGPGH